jgi:hypothetical protein
MAIAAESAAPRSATRVIVRAGLRGPSTEHGHEDQRPHQVQLLLDREAPGVGEHRRRQAPVPVAGTGEDVVPVGDEEEGGQAVGAHRAQVDRGHVEPGVHGHRDDHHEERGQQAARPPAPERPEAHRAVGPVLEQQQRRDEVARQHEEQVDAQPPAGQVPAVEQQHGGDGQPAQAIVRRDACQPRRCGSGGRRLGGPGGTEASGSPCATDIGGDHNPATAHRVAT